jgi:predicted phosphodiesterase
MRVALISDLHGNALSLRAVLDDIARVGVDRIVCLGDCATLGPEPEAVLDTLGALGCPVILGNHDDFLLDPQLIRRYTEVPVVVDAVDWCRDRLGRSHLDFVRTFRPDLEIDLGEGASLYLFHGSPRSHMEDLLATTPPDELDRFLDGHSATVMAGGHTHVQMLRQHRGALLVNPGSVGMPFREANTPGRAPTVLPHAEYAIVRADAGAVTVSLHRVAVDREALRRAARATDHPLGEMLAAAYA